ncbi:hypothetical protein LCGC14_2853600 [marine sediment metagenome]|uniref:Uncharacterized protein n=1 Tax=marine sediment metagenome TaxID=412755 RepID=A0A0F8Y7N4_9ZZZZ
MAEHGHGRRRPELPEQASGTAKAAVARGSAPLAPLARAVVRKRRKRTANAKAGTNPFAGLSRRRQ